MTTQLCTYCGSTYDWLHGHHCTPTWPATSTGGHMTDKRDGYPGSGHGPTMPPPPPDPSGSPPATEPGSWADPIPATVEQFGPILDPVRARALHEAIRYSGMALIPVTPERILEIAETFETWLARDEEAD